MVIAALLTIFTISSSATLIDNIAIRSEKFPEGLIEISADGKVFRPMEGFGPVVISGNETLIPGQYSARLIEESLSSDGKRVRLVYRLRNHRPTTEFAVVITKDPELSKVSIALEGIKGEFAGVHPGRFAHDNNLVGFSVPTRYREDYARHGRHPDLFYRRDMGFWFSGGWDLDVSNASTGSSLYPRKINALTGEDAFFFPGLSGASDGEKENQQDVLAEYFLGDALNYLPLQDGSRRPLQERFDFTLSPDLWGAVAVPSNRPSSYAKDMKDMIYIDIWGGFYPDRSEFTQWMQETVGKYIGGLSIVQNWQGGGFDSNLPLAIADELPPHERMAGTAEQLKGWMDQMKSWGRAGLRTNYQLYRSKESPLPQTVRRALAANGSQKWHTQQQDVLAVIEQQEAYIQSLLETTATFSDQLTSGGPAWAYVDFTPDNPDAGTIRGARDSLRAQARAIHDAVGGPLLSETLNSEFLIGEYVDSGDYGIFEGFNRLVTPEYKLRRLHGLSVMYGMGLGYRFFYGPPYGGTTRQSQGQGMYRDIRGEGSDDYRTMTIAWGNGAYLDYSPNISTFEKGLTEALTVGILQGYYLMQPVREITYEVLGSGDAVSTWRTLEELLLAGENPQPFFARIRIVYENGLTVVINRRDDPLFVTLPVFGGVILPKHSWAVWTEDGTVEGFSGIPGSSLADVQPYDMQRAQESRIDYTRDDHKKFLFVNPRDTGFDGLSTATIFENGIKVYELPEDRRYRKEAEGVVEEHFTNALRWMLRGHATITSEGEAMERLSFVRIETDGTPERIDRPLGRMLEGKATVRYRTRLKGGDGERVSGNRPSFGNVALMRFGLKDGSVRELPGRRWMVLPDTDGEWQEKSFDFHFDEEGTSHVILRLAASDTEIRGVTPSTGWLDIDYIRIEPLK